MIKEWAKKDLCKSGKSRPEKGKAGAGRRLGKVRLKIRTGTLLTPNKGAALGKKRFVGKGYEGDRTRESSKSVGD